MKRKVPLKRARKRGVVLTVRFPEDLYEAMKARAVAEDLDVSKVIRRAIRRENRASKK